MAMARDAGEILCALKLWSTRAISTSLILTVRVVERWLARSL